MLDVSQKVQKAWDQTHRIPGWLAEQDCRAFAALDSIMTRSPVRAILEIGTYRGRTAAFLQILMPDADVTVVDPFEAGLENTQNAYENQFWYPDILESTFRARFEETTGRPVTVVAATSDKLLDHLPSDSAFDLIHIDGSHLHSAVANDILVVRKLISPGGILVFDDYRQLSTPGVAAAVWAATAELQLHPFLLTDNKFYASKEAPPAGFVQLLENTLRKLGLQTTREAIYGAPVLRTLARVETAAQVRPLYWRAATALLPPIVQEAVRRVITIRR